MRGGMNPEDAIKSILNTINGFYPGFNGAMFAVMKNGTHGKKVHKFIKVGSSEISP